MTSKGLERQRILQLIEAAGDQLAGDWVLVGGALAALWLSPERVTEDIDLISLSDRPEQRYQLMDFALAQGLPLEAVNSAADFFLRRIPGWADDLELFHAGSQARIFRPTPTLFLLLKSRRLSEADLSDCLALLDLTRRGALAVDASRVLSHLDALGDPPSERAGRRRARRCDGAGGADRRELRRRPVGAHRRIQRGARAIKAAAGRGRGAGGTSPKAGQKIDASLRARRRVGTADGNVAVAMAMSPLRWQRLPLRILAENRPAPVYHPHVHPLADPLSHDHDVDGVVFSPDANKLVTLSGATAQVWDLPTPKPPIVLRGHALRIGTAAAPSTGRGAP